jgi:hypothetical protein
MELTPSLGKKLKRRLEDLERRAGSSSVSPPQMHVGIQQMGRPGESRQHYKRSPETQSQQPSPRLLPSQFTPQLQSQEDGIFANSFEWDRSKTPPLLAYHTYPGPEDNLYPPYSQPYHPILSSGDWTRTEADSLAPVSVTLPSMMQFHDSIKWEYEDTLTPFNMTYQGPPVVDIHGHSSYNGSNPHVCSTRAPLHRPY